MSPEDRAAAEQIVRELERRKQRTKIETFYQTPENRAGYPVHMAFFKAGATYKQRLALAANRVGKTEGMGGYETVLHLTGRYPDWWEGKRFTKPVSWWIGGDTSTTVRDIIQLKLLGTVGSFGTGLIPGDLLIDTSGKRGVPDAIENIYVKHVSGGRSVAQLKSYDQGREAWQGTEQHGVWLDEEPPMPIYSEALVRTMTTGGIVLNTYTPMNGMTEVTESFLSIDRPDSKFVCTASWDDCAHLDAATKLELWNSIPVHERDARSKGIPTIGVGKIYPFPLEDMLVDPFDLPKHWVKGYALDVGWNKTAALWGALDRDSDTLYLYSEHYQGMGEPAVHASAIKARGEMTGYIDPAAQGGSQADGEKLIQLYRNEGLKLAIADNAKEAGIFDVYQRMTSGRVKIFRTLVNLQKEIPLYHRDANGAIVKKNDHLMDCFHGETLVMTESGEVPIKNLVGKDGNVFSLDGNIHPYRNCKIYRENCELVTLSFHDGRSVTCTPDHLFLTSDGRWVMANDMLGEIAFDIGGNKCRSSLSMKSNKSSRAKDIGCAVNISKDTARDYIEQYGKMPMGQFLKDLWFTIRTKTGQIMTFPTLNLWTTGSTCHTTPKASQTSISTWQLRQQKSGMVQWKVWSGIKSITKTLRKQCMHVASGIATIVGRGTKPLTMEKHASVPTIANPQKDEKSVPIWFPQTALFAGENLEKTSISQLSHVELHAVGNIDPSKVVKIVPAPNGDAYCLTVDSTHAFAVCGGIIVHNCLRYLVRATPVLTYASEKSGHYGMTQSGVQYRTSRPTRGNRYGD